MRCRWNKLCVIVLILLLAPCPRLSAAAPSVTGLWLTQDHEGVIAIAPCGPFVCGRIVGVFLDPNDPMPVDHRGVSQCDLLLIINARQIKLNLWKGRIIDPRNGHVYGAELHLDPHGNLGVRGFLGVPLLGHTQTWTRYRRRPPADCRIRQYRGTAPQPANRYRQSQ